MKLNFYVTEKMFDGTMVTTNSHFRTGCSIMKNNTQSKDAIKSVTLSINTYEGRKLEIPLEVWQVNIICRTLGLSVDTVNLDTYHMRSKEQTDKDLKLYYQYLRTLHHEV